MLGHATLLLACSSLVLGHGRVTQPPSRASAWRVGFPTPANYDDDGLNCGGFSTQWSSNGGKCGICGDAYNIPPPRPHEIGGTYGLGVIVAKYLPGATIATTTHLTASHMGYWEYKLCPDPTDNTQACFDQHLLVSEEGETKYTPKRGSGIYEVNYKLPSGLICEHCVLQWRYVAGNNWGVCSNGTSGLGCGNQEEFRACSDIAIMVSKTQSDTESIPSPLLYYLQHGFYELDQGYLTRDDPKRPTPPQRPTNSKPSNRQPKPSKNVPQPNRQAQNSNRPHPIQPSHPSNRQPQPSKGQTQSQRQPPQSNAQQYSLNRPQPNGQQHPNSQQYHPSQYPPNLIRQQSPKTQPYPSKEVLQYLQTHGNSHPQYSIKPQQQTSRLTHSNQQSQNRPQHSKPGTQKLTQTTHQTQPNQHLSSQKLIQTTQLHTHPSKRPEPSNRQPQHSKPSKQQASRPKSVKRQPKTKQTKLLRYEYKTNDKRKTRNKRKKKKTQPGLHHKNNKPKRPVKVFEQHTYQYF